MALSKNSPQVSVQRDAGDLPLVSVCINAYNHERYVGEAIESVFAQTYPNIELIIADDASTDGTAAIIESYAQRYPERMTTILLTENEGPCRAGNRTYARARGEFVAYLGSDDRMLPDRISRQVAFLQAHPDHVVVFSQVAIIDGNSDRAQTPNGFDQLFNQPIVNLRRQLLTGNFFNAPSALLRRADLIAVGGSSPLLRYVQDYDLWVRLLARGEIARLDEVLTEYRVHGSNLSIAGANGPSYAARCETMAVIVSLVEQWPLQSFFDQPLRSPEEHVAATLALVDILKGLDRQFFGKASLGSALAYRLILEASRQDAIACQLAKNALETFMEGGQQVAANDLQVRHLLPEGGVPPVGVVIHAFYPDVLEELLSRLDAIDHPLYLYVTCPPERLREVAALLAGSGLPHLLLTVENRGRDVLPFLRILPAVQRDGIQVVLKLHTKKTLHLERGGDWAQEMFNMLLDPAFFQATLARFAEDPSLTLVGPERYRLPIAQYLRGNNRQHLQMLAQRAGIAENEVMASEFYAGTMFFVRAAGLIPIQSLELSAADFEPEQGQLDGTLAHAMERFFLPLAQGHRPPDRAMLYRQWLNSRQLDHSERERLAERLASWPDQPSILLVVDDVAADAALVGRTLESLGRQLYVPGAVVVFSHQAPEGIEAADNLLWLPRRAGALTQLNELLAQIEVDWCYLLRSGDVLDPHALLLLAERVAQQPQLLCCYSDEDLWSEAGGTEPVFKPAFNLDLLRSYPYVGRALAFQRRALLDIGGLRDEFASLAPHDLLLRLLEQSGLACIGHLAEVLVHQHEHLGQWLAEEGVADRVAPLIAQHLSRLGVAHRLAAGSLPMINRVTYLHDSEPLVSIIVPTKDELPMLLRCVESVVEKTRYQNYEILIVDNASETPEARQWLGGMEALGDAKVRILRYPHPFNYSAINNFASAEARGDYLVLLNNDTAIFDGDWLTALLHHAQRPEVGAVGAKLYYPDGRIQHGGVVLGLRGVADHPFIGEPGQAPGYMHRLHVDQNYSVVTAACLMVRKATYLEVGGMDDQDLKVSFNDVDFCLKLTTAGYLNVWTPYAAVMHEANVSQNRVDTTAMEAKVKRFQGEQAVMYQRWLPRIARDPAYNLNLSLDGSGFALDHRSETGWHPFSVRQLPYALCHPADPYGCGHYRIRKPFEAMQNGGLLEGGVSERLLTPVEKERLAPTSIVFQRQIMGLQIESIREAKRYSQAFRIYELDDYIVDLPIKNRHRAHMPKDVAKQLRRGVALCDRFVVSTAPLAEAFKDLHPDIRIAENLLPLDWWQDVKGQRRDTRKPRVGWGGGISHDGDLELIRDVVKDLADEVDWVFFGMCPDELRPYIKEFHAGVPIDRYAAKLASLDLDLALAPLEENLFNDCKSNLRLLEYGACGFAVVCSDLVCYRGDLPVTRVKNRYRDWVDAIRMHLADRDATHRAGEVLRQTVLQDWMLSGARLERWRSVWLPD
ncbi:hypothetical protein thsps117_37010 [Pseudomonas sp. No.117]